MKKLNVLLTVSFMVLGLFATAQPDVEIPNREAGKCYAKCLIPDEYETYTEEIQVREASRRTEVVPEVYETVTETYVSKEAGTKLVAIPAQWETVSEQYVTKEASSRLEVVPAVYETVSEQVLVKEAGTRIEIIPAEWATESRTVLTKAAGSRIERVPAKYTTETETIEIEPATTKWVKRRADRNCLSADPNDCLVWCLVEVPARYQTVTRQVRVGCDQGFVDNGDDCTREITTPEENGTITYQTLARPAQANTIEIPAEYGTKSWQKLVTPATTRSVEIPAEYGTRTYQRLVSPATVQEEVIPEVTATRSYQRLVTPSTVKTIDIPGETKTITKRRLVRKGGFTEWREVVCSNQVTTALVQQVQSALMSRGYDVGAAGADNVFGAATKAALVKFQKDNGLPVGQLDKETLKALGISGY